jgi:hypothetical protein
VDGTDERPNIFNVDLNSDFDDIDFVGAARRECVECESIVRQRQRQDVYAPIL